MHCTKESHNLLSRREWNDLGGLGLNNRPSNSSWRRIALLKLKLALATLAHDSI
jgi:hypothetical protein